MYRTINTAEAVKFALLVLIMSNTILALQSTGGLRIHELCL